MIPQNFTHKSQEAIQAAQVLANEFGHLQVEPPHLFLALLQQEDGVVVAALKKLSANIKQLQAEAEQMVNAIPRSDGFQPRAMGQVLLGPGTMYILEAADQEAKKNAR